MVVSIHSHHANRIYAGTKPFEFRRVGAGFVSGDLVLIYETTPVQAVTGTALVEHVVRTGTVGSPLLTDPYDLAALEPDRHERARVRRYLDGAPAPVALRLIEARRFAAPHLLLELGLSRAPQSYQFLGA